MFRQPEFYHFTEDSIALAKYVASQLHHWPSTKTGLKVLDLCAGCGVVGIEFARLYPWINSLHFIEKQREFKASLEHNVSVFAADITTEIELQSYTKVRAWQSYDLILSNPPYFLHGRGRAPQNRLKLTCEFMDETNYQLFFRFVEKSLSLEGLFYFLGREDQFINRKMLQDKVICIEKDLGKTKIFSFNGRA